MTIRILRTDATTWTVENVKHVMFRRGWLTLIVGEHSQNREYIWIPVERIEHLRTPDQKGEEIAEN
jgi:hypothetical protein